MDRLNELELFCEIASLGSLAAAARKSGRPASAVTRTLNALEERLGVRLVERTTRRSALTGAGQRLAQHARRLLDDFEAAMADTAGSAAAPTGTLRVTAPLLFGQKHMAPLVSKFLDAFPEVSVELSLADRIIDLIEEGIDVALRIGVLADSTLVTRRVGSVSRVIVASPAYVARCGAPASPSELPQHAIVSLATTAAGEEWHLRDHDGTPQTFKVRSRYTVNKAELAITAALEGRGLMSTFSYQVAGHLRSGRLLRLLEANEPPPVPVQLVFPSNRHMSGRLRAFLDFATPRLRRISDIR